MLSGFPTGDVMIHNKVPGDDDIPWTQYNGEGDITLLKMCLFNP